VPVIWTSTEILFDVGLVTMAVYVWPLGLFDRLKWCVQCILPEAKLGIAGGITVTVIILVVCDRPPLVPVMLKVNPAETVEATLIVRLDVLVEPAVVIVTGFGTKPSVTPTGRVDVDRVMLPVNAPWLVKLTMIEPEEPAGMLRLVVLAEMVKSLTTRVAVPELVR
jgi:hypothetical protein